MLGVSGQVVMLCVLTGVRCKWTGSNAVCADRCKWTGSNAVCADRCKWTGSNAVCADRCKWDR